MLSVSKGVCVLILDIALLDVSTRTLYDLLPQVIVRSHNADRILLMADNSTVKIQCHLLDTKDYRSSLCWLNENWACQKKVSILG